MHCLWKPLSKGWWNHLSGSILESAEQSVSLVKGGRSEYAAALAWEKKGAFPGHRVFTDWLESTKDNPVVIDFEVREEQEKH